MSDLDTVIICLNLAVIAAQTLPPLLLTVIAVYSTNPRHRAHAHTALTLLHRPTDTGLQQ